MALLCLPVVLLWEQKGMAYYKYYVLHFVRVHVVYTWSTCSTISHFPIAII